MRTTSIALCAGLVAFFLGSACAPKPTPTVSTTAPPPRVPLVTATVAAPTPAPLRPEEAAWDKVTAEAKKEGKLNFYSGVLIGDLGTALGQAFKERYGITVENMSGRGAEQLERLKSERRLGQMTADVWDGASLHGLNIKRAGIGATAAELPVFGQRDIWLVDPFGTDPDRILITNRLTIQTFLANTKLVKPSDEPVSYEDILRPRWKGVIAYGDPITVSAVYTQFWTMIRGGLLRKDYINDLGKQTLIVARSSTDALSMLARGEALLAHGTSSYASAMIAQGAPMKMLSLKEGAIALPGGLMLIKDGPHPHAAKLFVNWLLSPEGQTIYSRFSGEPSMRKDVPSFVPPGAEVKAQMVAVTGEDLEQANDAFNARLWVDILKGK